MHDPKWETGHWDPLIAAMPGGFADAHECHLLCRMATNPACSSHTCANLHDGLNQCMK